MGGASTLKLGLIGDNIAASRAPDLHRIAGRLNNMDVQYDRLIPKELNQTFDQIFETCRDNGYQALNITYPYKEHVVSKVEIDDPMVRSIAAVNTVVFQGTSTKAFNTDYTGFIAAYEQVRAGAKPGVCCLVGTGGVGRALAFGLVKLGADEIRLFDRDSAKAQQLAYDLNALDPQTVVTAVDDLDVATANCDGLLNGTPLGMVGYPGSALNQRQLPTRPGFLTLCTHQLKPCFYKAPRPQARRSFQGTSCSSFRVCMRGIILQVLTSCPLIGVGLGD